MKAAVFHGPHQPLTIEEVDIAKPIFDVAPSATISRAPSSISAIGATFIPPPKNRPLQTAII